MYNEETYIEPQYSKQMSNDEVIYYMTRYKSGDLEARKKIIESYISYVKLIVRSNFKGGIYEEDDLIAIGIHGLIKSVDKFDLDRYNKFKSFATKCIFNEIFYFMRKSKKHYINDKITSMSDLDNVENLIVDKNVNIEADYEKKAIINDILKV